jgi:hypothetical protein
MEQVPHKKICRSRSVWYADSGTLEIRKAPDRLQNSPGGHNREARIPRQRNECGYRTAQRRDAHRVIEVSGYNIRAAAHKRHRRSQDGLHL